MDNTEGRELAPTQPEPTSAIVKAAMAVQSQERVIAFQGRPLLQVRDPFPHFIPLRKERFDKIAYPILGGKTRSAMNDAYAYLSNTVEDLTHYSGYVLFGIEDTMRSDGDLQEYYAAHSKTVVWDMASLEAMEDGPQAECVRRSPYSVVQPSERIPFIMSLAGGDSGLYDDIMQSLAPIIMRKKPDGVIWWVGNGANGKSTLMDALYRIFPGQLASINLKRLVDGRDVPSLNGMIANIVKESSEGRVDDTEIYKSLGTHESFRVHRFHSQDDIEINGNLHTIFSANNIPTFNDKGYSARRRTYVIPFGQQFESDPDFESKTFTNEFFGQLISEMMKYAKRIEHQGYRYKWSAATLTAKADYDREANNAEEYAAQLIGDGVVMFESFNPVRMDYENWCAENGYVPLGIGNLRKAMGALGFERTSYRPDAPGSAPRNVYRLKGIEGTAGFQVIGMNRPGLFVLSGFRPTTVEEKMGEDEPQKSSILNGKW